MLHDSERRTKTGELGEKLVARYYRSLGFTVEESLNLNDSKKDMLVGNKTCEVKTQQVWHKENSFSIRVNQLKKCNDVDILIFVETPSKYNQNTVRLHEMPKDKRKVKTLTTSDGRTMHLFSKNNAILLKTITDEDIVKQFERYSLSKWK
jgi:hypothetical protein